MRRLLLAIAALLLTAIIALLLALRSESFTLAAVHWAVAAFSDFRLELRSPTIDVYGGSMSADEIHLLAKTGDGPALLSVLGFAADAGLAQPAGMTGPGSSLRAESVLIYVSDSEKSTNPEPMQWLGYLGWLPTRLDIDQVHLVTTSANTWIFPLKQLHGKNQDNGNYQLTADADYQGEPLGVVLDVLAVDRGRGVTAADVKITLSAPASGSEISLAGAIEGSDEYFQYNFALDAFYRDIHEFLKGFEGGAKLAGSLRLHGTMVGNASGFVLSDANFVLDNMPEYGFEAGGWLDYRLSGETAIDLVATGEMASLSYLLDWVDLDVADFGRAQSSVRLTGSLDRPVLEEIRMVTSNEAGLTVGVSGQVNLYEAQADGPSPANGIFLDIQGPSLGVLGHWLGELPYEPGPWRASGLLSGDQTRFSLRDIVVETGTPDTVALRATGSVGTISPAPDGKYSAGDIQLSVQADTPDSAQLARLLGLDAIPPYHEISATAKLGGTSEEMQLSDGELHIGTSDLDLRAGSLSAVLRPGAAQALSGLAGSITVELSDVATLSRYTTRPVPVLGPLHLTGKIAQKEAVFQLLDIVAAVRDGDSSIETRGRIGNVAGFSDVSLANKIAGLDMRTLLATLLPDFAYGGSLGAIGGSFKLAEKKGVWTVSQLALASGDGNTPLELQVDGEIDDLGGLVTANLDARFRLADPALLQSLGAPALASVSGSLAVTTTPGEILGKLKAQVGETHLSGDSRITVSDDRVKDLRLTLATPHLYLKDFGFQAAAQAAPKDASPSPQSANLLTQLREHTPPFPVDVTLKIDGISGEYSSIDSLVLRLTGTDKRYTLEQFSASYNKALAEIRGIIDLNPDPPAASLAGQANALPLSAILRDLGVTTNVSGALTILGGVTVMGDTTDALVRNLNGSLAFALENAVIEGAAYDVLATDLLAWIYSGALTEKSTYLDCTMARFQLQQGVATTDSLYIESAKMVATGSANFDLVQRKMDIRITPLSKSRVLQVPSEVRLKGDMASPKAEISPVSAVADATSAALMLIPSLTMKLFGVNQGSTKSYRPCQAELAN